MEAHLESHWDEIEMHSSDVTWGLADGRQVEKSCKDFILHGNNTTNQTSHQPNQPTKPAKITADDSPRRLADSLETLE